MSDDAIKYLEEAIDAKLEGKDRQVSTSAVVTRVDPDGTAWFHIPGGADETPARFKTAEVVPGDVVSVSIEGGTATINGNVSDPSASGRAVGSAFSAIDKRVEKVEQTAGGTLTKYAEITADIERLRSVYGERLDGIDGRVEASETAIEQNSREIALKASSSSVTALGTRVTAAEQKITPDAIVQTVSSSNTFQPKGDYPTRTQMSSAIEETAGSITERVEKVEGSGYVWYKSGTWTQSEFDTYAAVGVVSTYSNPNSVVVRQFDTFQMDITVGDKLYEVLVKADRDCDGTVGAHGKVVSSNEVTSFSKGITYTNSQIQLLDDKISLKASQTSVDSLGTRVSAAEQKITPSEIVSTVSKSGTFQPKGDYQTVSGMSDYQTKSGMSDYVTGTKHTQDLESFRWEVFKNASNMLDDTDVSTYATKVNAEYNRTVNTPAGTSWDVTALSSASKGITGCSYATKLSYTAGTYVGGTSAYQYWYSGYHLMLQPGRKYDCAAWVQSGSSYNKVQVRFQIYSPNGSSSSAWMDVPLYDASDPWHMMTATLTCPKPADNGVGVQFGIQVRAYAGSGSGNPAYSSSVYWCGASCSLTSDYMQFDGDKLSIGASGTAVAELSSKSLDFKVNGVTYAQYGNSHVKLGSNYTLAPMYESGIAQLSPAYYFCFDKMAGESGWSQKTHAMLGKTGFMYVGNDNGPTEIGAYNDNGGSATYAHLVASAQRSGQPSCVSVRAGASTTNPNRHGLYSDTGSSWFTYRDGSGTIYHPTSSSRFRKENIEPMSDDDAEKLLELGIVKFDYREEFGGAKDCRGVIAEDTCELFPDAICEAGDIEEFDNTAWMGVDYTKFIPYIIRLCQLQQERIEELERRLGGK